MLKKILGAVSPAYGILTGKGAMGKAASKGLLGALPRAIAKDAQKSGGKSGSAEPEEGAPETGRPRGRGMLGRVPMSTGLLARIAADKSMRGASTQGMKKGGKVKKYQDGGIVGNSNYPFGQGQMTSEAPESPSGGFGNTSPLVQVNAGAANAAAEKPFGMKKGGAVKATKSHRGDGIAQRGRTKGRFV